MQIVYFRISSNTKTIFTPRDKVFITDLKKIHCCKGIQKKKKVYMNKIVQAEREKANVSECQK